MLYKCVMLHIISGYHVTSRDRSFMSVGCSVWTRKANTAAENGMFYGWTSESDCMAGCLKSTSCVAFDLHPYGCILHNNADDLETTFSAPGVTQFVLNRNCLPTSPLSTESPLTTTTSAAITTGMFKSVFGFHLEKLTA